MGTPSSVSGFDWPIKSGYCQLEWKPLVSSGLTTGILGNVVPGSSLAPVEGEASNLKAASARRNAFPFSGTDGSHSIVGIIKTIFLYSDFSERAGCLVADLLCCV